MSRREGRDSDSKRHRSKFDREPSPKRSRRDGKPATERIPSNPSLDIGDHTERNQKHRQRLQDALPLETPLPPDSKVETGAVSKESDKKTSGLKEPDENTSGLHIGTKHSTDPTEVPRSRSYFQHDERGNAGQVGRNFSRRATTERGWWRDSKDQHSEREVNKTGNYETQQRDEKSQARRDDNRVWRHDGFFEMEADPALPARKRPAFREKKNPADSENVEKAATEPVKPNRSDRPALGSERREEREGRNSRHLDRTEKPFVGDRVPPNRGEAQRAGPSRERYGGGGGNYRGRDRFNGRQGYHSSGRVEKWKHDLYDESTRSPPPKNEEDQIAKVEALLAL
ncbi:hypothetical protein L1049_014674 [Liquidambar formosana]|uniref:Btz domain-containing protein n=1 Tax=Liquidambar formosana TaxID=63359 RepID=A0AAP0WZ59_LIQFO